MSIDKNRGDFLAVIIIALLATAASLPVPLTFICGLIVIGCSIALAQLSEQHAGYILGGLAIVCSGVASVALVNLWEGIPLPVSMIAAISAMLLSGLWLVRRWNRRIPVRYGQQVNLSTIFGVRKIRGPSRYRRPSKVFGSRIISAISLRQIKSAVRVTEIDIRPATAPAGAPLRVVRPTAADLVNAYSPTKIHAVELNVSYSIDGDQWFLLYNVPHADQYTANLGPRVGRDQPEYWEAIVSGYVAEESDEVLRRVVQREGWSATTVRDQRGIVAEQLYADLSDEAAKMGIIIHHIELLTVDVDAPEALRAARNSSVYGLEMAEHQARVGNVRIGLHRSILRDMHELLSDTDHPLPAEAVAAIVRSQIRELGRAATPATGVEDLLEDMLALQQDAPRRGPAPAGRPRPQRHTRDAA